MNTEFFFFISLQFENTKFYYFVAGSKLEQYVLFQGLPNFDQLRDDQFYYYSCTWASPITNNTSTVRAFNQVVGKATNFKFTKHGIFELDYTVQPRTAHQRHVHTITHTDNETYVFFYTCISGTERGWLVYSALPNLGDSSNWRKTIEEQAASLGFDRSKFTFMKRSNCIEPPAYKQNVKDQLLLY